MNKPYDLFIFCGEPSGDLQGEQLIKALKRKSPHLRIKGVGGPRMRKTGFDCFMPMESFEVMGLTDVFLALPRIYRHFIKIRNEILKSKPKATLFIDYPGFSLRMARSLKKRKAESKLLQLVCPSVWAGGKRRIPFMEKNLDKLMTILPFEAKLFSSKLLDVEYVGHHLTTQIKSYEYNGAWRSKYGISNHQKILSLFPGSRRKEIERNFPLQLKAAHKFLEKNPETLLAISFYHEKFRSFFKQFDLKGAKLIHSDQLYELMRASHLAIATSGTITLELALHTIPTVVTYSMRPLDVWIARHILRINLPYYSLPNIIAEREVFPELIGSNLEEDSLFNALQRVCLNRSHRKCFISRCEEVRKRLGNQDACENGANAILKLIDL